VRGEAEEMQVTEIIFTPVVEKGLLMGVKRSIHSPAEKGTSER
jgi:hypothetical protein